MGMPVSPTAQPRYPIAPLVAGAATCEIALDADLTTATDQPLLYTRLVVDPGDDVAAAEALMSGIGCKTVLPGERRSFDLAAGAVAIYLVAVGSAAEPADYAGGAGVISVAEDDLADVAAQMIRLDISALDLAKSFSVAMTPTYASGLAARLLIEVDSHA